MKVHLETALDPLAQGSYAEGLVRETAQRLREVLHSLCREAQPFPRFLNMPTIQAVEAEPSRRPPGPGRGCVVVLPDGELYELSLRFIPGPPGMGGIDQVEEFTPLDLPPSEYIPYAYSAIRALVHLLEERQGKASPP